MTINKIGKKRLMNVVKALRDAAKNDELVKAFTMRFFGWSGNDYNKLNQKIERCGTPACALGHYAARKDLQKKFTLATRNNRKTEAGKLIWRNGVPAEFGEYARDGQMTVSEYFDISKIDVENLFNSDGCDNAKTPTDAANYIEKFVKEH